MSIFTEMKDFVQVGENLVRHAGGTIYLRAKVRGKVIKVSLGTKELKVAKLARDDRLTAMRAAALAQTSNVGVRTLGDAVAVLSARLVDQPHLSAATQRYYRQMIQILKATLPTELHARTWTAKEAASWWRRIAAKYSSQRANNVLGVAKQVGKLIVELGLRVDDPTEKLKRLPIQEKDLIIPSRQQVMEIVGSIRGQGKSNSEEAADYVEFLAFAGCRHGQAKAFLLEHDEGEWLKFPSGVVGTKGASTRRLPISPPLRVILDRIRKRLGDGALNGPMFKIQTPRIALGNSCKRLGLSHVRIHDLRHFFTTFAIEAGVDIPTVSRWLGHKDGGRLLLKTYGHLRDEHSLHSASKLH